MGGSRGREVGEVGRGMGEGGRGVGVTKYIVLSC